MAYPQMGTQLTPQTPKPTVGSAVQDILDRAGNCHSYISQIEDRIIGPRPSEAAINQQAPNSLADALELSKGRIAALEDRLARLLDCL